MRTSSANKGLDGDVGEGVAGSSYECGSGEGEDPCPNNSLSPDPADSVHAAGGSHTGDSSADGVSGGDRNLSESSHADRQGSGELCRKTADGTQMGGNAGADGFGRCANLPPWFQGP